MRSLEYQGVKTLFGYPGGSILPTFDALYHHRNTLNHILVRHEQGAAPVSYTHLNRSYSQKEPDVFKKGLVLFLKELDV